MLTAKTDKINLTKHLRRIYDVFVRKQSPRCHTGLTCQYSPTGDNRYGCAVGCLLTPAKKEYFDSLDETGVDYMRADDFAKLCTALQLRNTDANRTVLQSLQDAHDNDDTGDLKTNVLSAVRRTAHNRRISMKDVIG